MSCIYMITIDCPIISYLLMIKFVTMSWKKYLNCIKHRCFKVIVKSLLATLEMYLHHKVLRIYKKNIDYFIAPSQFMKDTVVSFSWDENKIEVIYNFSEKMIEHSSEKIEDYGLFFGRLSREKGVDILLRALSLSKKHNTLKIVGQGPEEDNLRQLVSDLKLDQRVEFLGYRSGEELHNIIRKARLIYLPSVWNENMPLTLLESLELGKVVVASKTGGLPELIESGQNGFLFEKANFKEIAQIIDDSFNYDLVEMGKKAKERVKDLKVENHMVKLLDLYNRVLKRY